MAGVAQPKFVRVTEAAHRVAKAAAALKGERIEDFISDAISEKAKHVLAANGKEAK